MTKYDTKNRYRVIIYARFSSKRQRDTSIEQQVDEIQTMIRRLKLPWVVVAIYADPGVSGRKTGRKELQKMQADLRAGIVKADLVLVTDLDRLSRAKRGGDIRAKLEKLGVGVTTSKSGFADPTSSENELIASVNEFRAREENILKGVRVKWAKKNLAEQGYWPGGPTPIGLMLVPIQVGPDQTNSKLAHNPETAWIVKRMFEIAHEQAVGPLTVAKTLNSEPAVVRQVGVISDSQVRSVLKNPIYIGTLRYNMLSTEIVDDTIVRSKNDVEDVVSVEGMCEPLIDPTVWQAVQDQFATRSTGTQENDDSCGVFATRHRVPLKRCLASLAVCAECGSAMHGTKSGDYAAADGSSRHYAYYTCPRRRSGCCGNAISVPAEWLEEYVVNVIVSELFGLGSPDNASQVALDRDALLASDVLDERCGEVESAITSMVDEGADPRDALEAERETLMAAKSGHLKSLGNIDLEDSAREAITAELATAAKRLKAIESELSLQESRDEMLGEVVDRDRLVDQLVDFHRVITTNSASAINILLHHHIDRIECHPDGRIRIVWTRLGIIGGREIEAFLAWFAADDDDAESGEDHTRPDGWIKPRRRAARQIGMEIEDFEEAQAANEFAIDPHRFEGLDSRWFVVTETTVPVVKCWAEEYAVAVAEFRLANHATEATTAKHFGVSNPTVRKALRIARDEHGIDATGKKVSRSNIASWARLNAQAVLEFVEKSKATLTAAATHFGKSQPTISKALRLARAERDGDDEANAAA